MIMKGIHIIFRKGEETMKGKKSIAMLGFYLIAGTVCACNQTKENKIPLTPTLSETAAPELTVPPTATAAPELTLPLTVAPELTVPPTVTAAPEEDLLPIDGEYFPDEAFREEVKWVDKNGDGFLSKEERNQVTWTSVSEGCMDGIEYFPNLRGVDICSGGHSNILLRNHPSLAMLHGDEGYVNVLTIENCPNLKEVYFHSFSVGELTISGDTTAELVFSYNSGAGHITLDDTVAVNFEDDEYLQQNYFYKDADGNFITECYDLEKYVFNDFTEWTGLGEKIAPLSVEEIKDFLAGSTVDCFSFEITEMPEGTVDNAGNPGYQVVVNNGEWGYVSMTLEVYAENVPAKEDFFVRPVEVQKVEVLKYSPKRGTVAKVKWKLEIGYRGAKEEIILTQTERNHYVLMIPDGTAKVYYTQRDLEESNEWNLPLKEGEVRINKESFTSRVFRTYIDAEYNVLDYGSSLSLKEREAITVMDFSDSIRFSGETLDGFEYFPNLTELYLGNTGTLIIENHPSVKVIGGKTNDLKKVVIRNCPNLETLDLDLSKVEEVIIEGCGKLQ